MPGSALNYAHARTGVILTGLVVMMIMVIPICILVAIHTSMAVGKGRKHALMMSLCGISVGCTLSGAGGLLALRAIVWRSGGPFLGM